jgi:hypothetical protein
MRILSSHTLMLVWAMLVGPAAYADVLNTGGGFNTSTGAFSAFNLGTQGSCSGGNCTDGTPFFNNTSSDVVNGSLAANAGDFLSASGGFATTVLGCSTCGVDYMANGGQMYTQSANSPNFASAFSFISQTGVVSISLLYANSSTNNNAEFGLYDASNQSNALTNHEVVQAAGTDLNNSIGHPYDVTNNYGTYGIYAVTCTVNAASGACPSGDTVTYYSDVSLNSLDGNTPRADGGHMHWALFQSGTNADVYFLALEDYALQGSQTRNSVEGYGDYNDIILELNTTPGQLTQTPEPETLPIIVLSLAGLVWLRSRKLKALR